MNFVTFFLLVALGYAITGIVGFGANILILPVLSNFYSIHDLIIILAFVSFVNSAYRIIENWKGIIWKDFLKVIAFTLSGTVLGLQVVRTLPENEVKLLLGCFVFAVAIYNLLQSGKRKNRKSLTKESVYKKIFYNAVLFMGGALQGAFVCGGPLYVIYFNYHYGDNRLNFRGMQFGILFFSNLLILLNYLRQNAYTGEILTMSLLGLFALVISITISSLLLKKMKDKIVYLLIQIVLLISGSSIAIQAMMKL